MSLSILYFFFQSFYSCYAGLGECLYPGLLLKFLTRIKSLPCLLYRHMIIRNEEVSALYQSWFNNDFRLVRKGELYVKRLDIDRSNHTAFHLHVILVEYPRVPFRSSRPSILEYFKYYTISVII